MTAKCAQIADEIIIKTINGESPDSIDAILMDAIHTGGLTDNELHLLRVAHIAYTNGIAAERFRARL